MTKLLGATTMLWGALVLAMIWLLALTAVYGTVSFVRRSLEDPFMWHLDQIVVFLFAGVLLVGVLFLLFGDFQ